MLNLRIESLLLADENSNRSINSCVCVVSRLRTNAIKMERFNRPSDGLSRQIISFDNAKQKKQRDGQSIRTVVIAIFLYIYMCVYH